ncbi:MAG: helix-turn-helix transcriptional regulator [Blastocatellia bacterium]|jgi:transcriptional regulator with XRE-family HTH domain
MGRSARERPKRLAEKLLQIRLALGLSQNQMLTRLGLSDKLYRTAVSGYELGTTEPPLLVLLKYSKIAGIHMEVLVDDELDLPGKLQSTRKPEMSKRETR